MQKFTADQLSDEIRNGWISVVDSWAYASADVPTFTITVPTGAAALYSAGMRIKLTQTTVKYFIITAVADTVLTVYGGTDYTLANAAISAISYSTQKAPLGFPLDPIKWSVKVVSTSDFSVAASANAYYNLDASLRLTIPIGAWNVYFCATCYAQNGSASTALKVACALSTSISSFSDGELQAASYIYTSTADTKKHAISLSNNKNLIISTKTLYYLVLTQQIAGTLDIRGDADGDTVLRAVCSYL